MVPQNEREQGDTTLSIVEAREQLTRLPEQFDQELKTHRNLSAIKVTRHNKPVLAILPWDLYESIVETLEILGDEEQMAELRQSIQEAAEGKGESWEAVKRELGWT
jgi:antitoxin YefM